MATYSVYVPLSGGGARRRADRTIFIREGFSLAAFVFGPLYLLFRRLWLATLGWIVVAALLVAAGHALLLPYAQLAILFALLGLLTGLEASMLRQFGLQRRGYVQTALLTAPAPEQAERAYFDREALREAPWRPAVTAAAATETRIGSPSEIIGMFPRAGDL